VHAHFSETFDDESILMRFHVMSFEGPDAYSRAGGIPTRIWSTVDITGLKEVFERPTAF
jgi:hypothetical protein